MFEGKIKLLGLGIISLGIVLLWLNGCDSPQLFSATPKISTSPLPSIRYFERNLPQGVAHILIVPDNAQFVVTPALSANVASVEEFAQKHQAIAIFNAGFFDPVNQKTTSPIVIASQLVANPQDNERLVNNPKLKSYLNLILNRSEFRRYLCGQNTRYEIALHNELPPKNCRLIDAIGAGPRLLPKLTLAAEGFIDPTKGRDALGSNQLNARTAVGITRDHRIIFVMVAQKPSQPNNSGISLAQLANLMKSLGASTALNLDGGSSSSFYYQGKTFYGKVDLQGNPIRRPVKSVLLVQNKAQH